MKEMKKKVWKNENILKQAPLNSRYDQVNYQMVRFLGFEKKNRNKTKRKGNMIDKREFMTSRKL